MLRYILSAAAAYLLGSLSFGIIFSKAKYKKDIRDFGSNNAGASNTLRTFGKGAAAFVFLFDALKGAAAVLLARYLLCGGANAQLCAYLAMLFSVLGHMFPVFFGFRGGKGVATTCGALAALQPITLPVVLAAFLIVLAFGKMISLASVVSSVLLPFATCFMYRLQGEPTLVPTVATTILALLIVFMHRENLRRILRGEERKLGEDKVDPNAEDQKGGLK